MTFMASAFVCVYTIWTNYGLPPVRSGMQSFQMWMSRVTLGADFPFLFMSCNTVAPCSYALCGICSIDTEYFISAMSYRAPRELQCPRLSEVLTAVESRSAVVVTELDVTSLPTLSATGNGKLHSQHIRPVCDRASLYLVLRHFRKLPSCGCSDLGQDSAVLAQAQVQRSGHHAGVHHMRTRHWIPVSHKPIHALPRDHGMFPVLESLADKIPSTQVFSSSSRGMEHR
ncbi:hypothetical protein FOZ63_003475 [Perkinsus olseni]|uniref:Uncharacterized protein n=1 Tax=Perkinsus olseni TaxID=32597 RepID=A0A7J6SZY7_PEROL|nr:hypothetical protein FOZ63_003475 [Perkinsus olseni]